MLSIVNHPKLKDYFQQDLLVFNEREISTDQKTIIIPDRLVIDNKNAATIIDYKTGKPERKHHAHLVNYAQVIGKMNYKINKKLLVYINDDILIDEVY